MRKQNCEPVGVSWKDAVSLGAGQRPLSLFIQMTSSFYYPIHQIPLLSSALGHIFFYLPWYWVREGLRISLKLHDPICEAWSSQYPACRRSCFSLAVPFPSAVHSGLLTAALNCCHVWILLLLCTHRWQNALISIGSGVWSKWCIKVWEKSFCLTS